MTVLSRLVVCRRVSGSCRSRPSQILGSIRPLRFDPGYQLRISAAVRGRSRVQWVLKGYADQVAQPPDRFAPMNRPKVVEAEVNVLGQLVRAKNELDAYAKTGQVMHEAIVDDLVGSEYLAGVTDHRPLRASTFH